MDHSGCTAIAISCVCKTVTMHVSVVYYAIINAEC